MNNNELFKVVKQRAFHFRDDNFGVKGSDKVWAAAYITHSDKHIYQAKWGRRGAEMDRDTKVFPYSWEADGKFNSMCKSKLKKKYLEVAFGDTSHGNIPVFQKTFSVDELGQPVSYDDDAINTPEKLYQAMALWASKVLRDFKNILKNTTTLADILMESGMLLDVREILSIVYQPVELIEVMKAEAQVLSLQSKLITGRI